MSITYRQGNADDTFAVYQVFTKALIDFGERTNVMAITGASDPVVMNSLWERRKPLFNFLAQDFAHFWVAEKDGEIVAYARSIQHGDVLELTEFFALPNQQSAGLGRELLSRGFPNSGTRYRTIVATLDERALFRYLSEGVYARFPIKYMYRQAEKVEIKTDLKIEPMDHGVHIEALNHIDQQLLCHQRESVHRWVITTRRGFVYKRDGRVVGYGYVGESSGPFALLDENDFPAVLAHAESTMAEQGKEFGVETPLINRKAIQYFTERKYRIDSFTTLFMSNEAFGQFENYLCFSPIFFL
jgi:GNAT superfamily N-acetyltransferase